MPAPIFLDPIPTDSSAEREEGESARGVEFWRHPTVELLDHPRLWRFVRELLDTPDPAWVPEEISHARSSVEVELLRVWRSASLRAELRVIKAGPGGNSGSGRRGSDPGGAG